MIMETSEMPHGNCMGKPANMMINHEIVGETNQALPPTMALMENMMTCSTSFVKAKLVPKGQSAG